tara:strand:+ start:3974 stop:4258 length:285 start_codon:yes stop_codon:yes gene_type:complete
MKKLSIKRLGMAFGSTGAILYLGCILLMVTVGREGTIWFFNSLLHGLDTTSIIRMDVPFWQALLGIGQTFILGWLIGALTASIYNFGLNTENNL